MNKDEAVRQHAVSRPWCAIGRFLSENALHHVRLFDPREAEVETLWEYHGRRLRPETPPEHLMDRVAFSQRPPVRVVRCNTCGFVYRNPIEAFRVVAPIQALLLILLL